MKIKRLMQLGSAFMLSISSLLFISAPLVHAAGGQTLTWCGANGADFNTASNWAVGDVSCSGNSNTTAYPGSDGNGDTLVFNLSNIPSGDSFTVNDDASSLSLATIEFTGGNGSSDGYGYDITGSNSITVTGGVKDNSIPYTGGDAVGGNVINSNINVGSSGGPIIFNISTGSTTTFASVSDSNDITVQGGGTAAFSTTGSASSLANYTGTISSSDGSMIQIQNDLSGTFSSSGTVAVSGTSVLDMQGGSCKTSCTYTYDFPISLGGSGTGKDSALNLDGYQDINITNDFSGPVTLTSNVAVSETTGIGDTTLDITGPINFGRYYIKTPVGPNVVTVNVPKGTNDSSETPNIGEDITYTDDGTVGSTTVESGGTLKGSGTANGVTVNSGGTVAPGDAPTCLTVNGNFTENGTYSPEIQSPGNTACTDYDQTIVTGNGNTINLTGGTLDVNLLNGFSPSVGQTFDIIENQTGDPVTGTFSNLAEGAIFEVGSTKFQITYKGGTSGEDVVLTVVSPSTPVTSSAKVPGTPDTGSALTSASVALPLLSSIATATGLYLISRRVRKHVAK
ncbi:MAG: hypothetical protein M1554_02330 [Patescibacteria group bacterium]|jgi:hypothetical protein|nr:hypothetical protein [Patescibacteria group bacterium]